MTPAESLQATLAGEHAAVYLYGVIGGRVSASAAPDLFARVEAAYTAHRGRRDQLIAMLRGQEQQPVPSAVAYELSNPARTTDQLTEIAREVEQRCAAIYADQVRNTAGPQRQWAIDALEDAAVRGLGFGSDPDPFPGLDEL